MLVNYMSDKYGGKCSNYCSSIGLRCTGAWEESKDTCTVQYQGKCATSFGTTSDAICQCSAGKAKTPGPPPRQYFALQRQNLVLEVSVDYM